MKRGPYKTTPPPGTVGDLVMRFRRSPRYLSWAASSREKRDAILGKFLAGNRNAMVAALRRGDVIAMRDEMGATPDAANNWLKTIRLLLAYGVDIEMLDVNVAAAVPLLESRNPDGHRTWREDEIAAYLAHHSDPKTIAHRAFVLALYTGAARVDLVKLGPGNVRDGKIVYRRQKTQRRSQIVVKVPILAELQAVLKASPTAMTYLAIRDGSQRSDKGLTGDFARWVRDAGLGALNEHGKALCLHGLRKALGRRLAEHGCTPAEIMAILGHATVKQAMEYCEAYDRSQAADSGMAKLAAPVESNVVRLERRQSES